MVRLGAGRDEVLLSVDGLTLEPDAWEFVNPVEDDIRVARVHDSVVLTGSRPSDSIGDGVFSLTSEALGDGLGLVGSAAVPEALEVAFSHKLRLCYR